MSQKGNSGEVPTQLILSEGGLLLDTYRVATDSCHSVTSTPMQGARGRVTYKEHKHWGYQRRQRGGVRRYVQWEVGHKGSMANAWEICMMGITHNGWVHVHFFFGCLTVVEATRDHIGAVTLAITDQLFKLKQDLVTKLRIVQKWHFR